MVKALIIFSSGCFRGYFLFLIYQSFAQKVFDLNANIKLNLTYFGLEGSRPLAVYNISALQENKKFPLDLFNHFEVLLYHRLFSNKLVDDPNLLSYKLKFKSIKSDDEWSVDLLKTSYRFKKIRFSYKLSKK